jgi:hypothetical protein
MSTVGLPAVSFTAGSVRAADWIVVAAQLDTLAKSDTEFTRAFVYKRGAWSHLDLPGIHVRSVYGVPPPNAGAYFLGRGGELAIADPAGTRIVSVGDAGTGSDKMGYLNQLRMVAGSLYACGFHGQVYRQNGAQWVHIDKGILESPSPTANIDLMSIDGTSQSNLFAAGMNGQVFRFNGSEWKQLESPTTQYLNWLKCVSSEEFYVCGRRSTFFHWNKGTWENLSLKQLVEDFWGIEVFEGKIYVSSLTSIFVLQEGQLLPIETGLTPKPDAFRLDSRDGQLWSFGMRHLCYFDGKQWTSVKHPDNP